MTEADVKILADLEQLTPSKRADLADCLIDVLSQSIPPEIERAQMQEVRLRHAQIQAGEGTLIPGSQALEQVRRFVTTGGEER